VSFRLLDQHEGLKTHIAFEPNGDFIIKTTQDVEPVVEFNKTRQTDGSNGYGKTRELRHVATVPDNIVYQWIAEAGIEPRRWMAMKRRERMMFLRRKLNDPDWRYLKTVSGRV